MARLTSLSRMMQSYKTSSLTRNAYITSLPKMVTSSLACRRLLPDETTKVTFQSRSFSNSTVSSSSPFDPKQPSETATKKSRKRIKFVPRKAAVQLTERARTYFKQLLENPTRPEIIGVMLNYNQVSSGEPRMVFSFSFVTKEDITEDDEGVSLEVLPDGTPKAPKDCINDGLPKLYVNHNAFLKVLGATVDIDKDTAAPILYDREGNRLDPNA